MMKDIKVNAVLKHDNIKTSASVGFIRTTDSSEPYTGNYDVTILNTTVLPTNGKRMTDDLTVRQGADTYTGAIEVTVYDDSVVLPTNSKLMASNVTINQGYSKYSPPSTLRTWPIIRAGYGFSWYLETAGKVLKDNLTIENALPEYQGSTSVYVTDSSIVLPTELTIIGENITVYQGIPLYRGATSFTITDSGLTIATSGKRLSSDITVDISALETLATQISEVVG